MKHRTLALAAVAALLMAAPSIAEAAWGQATGFVNMRTGPAVSYAKITTLPAGASVWIDGKLNGWYHLIYNGRAGFVSGSYITTRVAMAPRMFFRGPPPMFGYMQKPWWDDQHHAWYDGHRWYHNGIWFNDPSGFSFGFSFGR